MRLIHDKRNQGKKMKMKMNEDGNVPPYVRKYNRRFKSIYESMHKSPYDSEKYAPAQMKKSKTDDDGKNVYGYFEKYQRKSYRTNNEIPEGDVLSEIMQKSHSRAAHHHHKKHHHNNHHHHHHHHQHHTSKIKKLRTRPEAGIMQKKLKY
jgi:G3E family GTPase